METSDLLSGKSVDRFQQMTLAPGISPSSQFLLSVSTWPGEWTGWILRASRSSSRSRRSCQWPRHRTRRISAPLLISADSGFRNGNRDHHLHISNRSCIGQVLVRAHPGGSQLGAVGRYCAGIPPDSDEEGIIEYAREPDLTPKGTPREDGGSQDRDGIRSSGIDSEVYDAWGNRW